MRFKKLDLNLLVALDTLIRTRNVSRAADEMFLTQSAMSNALARLRDHFGDPLLVQVKRKMELSPLAETLREPLREIIVRIEMALEAAPTFSPETSTRRIGIMLSDYTLYTVMPAFLREVAQKAPGLMIELRPQFMLPYLLLERGEADLLIAPDIVCSSQHPSELLFSDQMCCLVDAGSTHPRRRFGRSAFEDAGHVVMTPPGGVSYAVHACREAGLSMRVEISTFSFSSLGDLVRGTQRVAVVHERLARRVVKEQAGLRMVATPITLPPMRQMMQWHKARTRDPALIWLRDELHRSVEAG